MKIATENLQKCMENVIHEKELCEGDHMSNEHYHSLVKVNKDPLTGVSSNKPMMCHWLGLMTYEPFESSMRTLIVLENQQHDCA